MNMPDLTAVIMAAGRGTRMKSDLPKSLQLVAGRPMLGHVLGAIAGSDFISKALVVVSQENREAIERYLKKSRFSLNVATVVQEGPWGTGGALDAALNSGKIETEHIFVIGADTPLLKSSTINSLCFEHLEGEAGLSLLTATWPAPNSYGKVLRNPSGEIALIMEAKGWNDDDDACDFEGEFEDFELEACDDLEEVNGGVYCMRVQTLMPLVKELIGEQVGMTEEFYLTDLVEMVAGNGGKIVDLDPSSAEEFLGVNTQMELMEAERHARFQYLAQLMEEGVGIVDPSSTYIDVDVAVGQDTVIDPGVFLLGQSEVGQRCRIEPYSVLRDSKIGNECHIKSHTVMESAVLADQVTVGPFAHLRAGTQLDEKAKIGNFVEVKESKIGKGSKANHHAYIGDTQVGQSVNIGAGVITCNYDGTKKHQTVIEDGVFVGSDSQLVAPIKIGKGAYVGSGSTLTQDVPPGALSLARSRQVNKENYKLFGKKQPRGRTK